VLTIVGLFVARDAARLAGGQLVEETSPLAKWVQSVEIPGTMVTFRVAKVRVSVLFVLPLGFLTGLLASTIAVGGFIGVPGMMYLLGAPSLVASATELVVAFVMGLGGTFKFALGGLVDIRLAMLILLGSLFGVQLGAIGTTFVRPHVIKVVMATVMLIVAASRALVIPVYLAQLGKISLGASTIALLNRASFALMVLALVSGAFIIIRALVRGYRTASPRPAL